MRGSSLMSYTYNMIEAYRQAAGVLAFLTLFLLFLGGYYSGRLGWKWMGLIVLLLGWKTLRTLAIDNIGEAGIKSYEKIILAIVCPAITLVFLLVFYFGYLMGPLRAWWAGLPLIFIYFLTAKNIHKPWK